MSLNGIALVQSNFQNGAYYKTLSFRDITSGSNGDYTAGVGWDAVTGMGSFASYTPVNITTTTTTTMTTTTATTTTKTTSQSSSTSSNSSQSIGIYIVIGVGVAILLLCIVCCVIICTVIICKSNSSKVEKNEYKTNLNNINLKGNNRVGPLEHQQPQLNFQPTTTAHNLNEKLNLNTNKNLGNVQNENINNKTKKIEDVDDEVEKNIKPVDPFFATYFGDGQSNTNTANTTQPQSSSSIEVTSTTYREANNASNLINTMMSRNDDATLPPLMPVVKSFNEIKQEEREEESNTNEKKRRKKKHSKNKQSKETFKANDD